jgi:hypothetical protein
MDVQSFTPVFPMPALEEAIPFFSRLLGIDPTYVDDDRWAQFDLRGRRLALSGTHRIADEPALMIKVKDIGGARQELIGAGFEVGEIFVGAHEHERRCVVAAPFEWVVMLYDPSVIDDPGPATTGAGS